jgi:hypothetical protein
MRQIPEYSRIYYVARRIWTCGYSASICSGEAAIGLPPKLPQISARNRFSIKICRALMATGDTPKWINLMPVFLLDLIYVTIGVAAFAITAFYLGACDNL